MSVGP